MPPRYDDTLADRMRVVSWGRLHGIRESHVREFMDMGMPFDDDEDGRWIRTHEANAWLVDYLKLLRDPARAERRSDVGRDFNTQVIRGLKSLTIFVDKLERAGYVECIPYLRQGIEAWKEEVKQNPLLREGLLLDPTPLSKQQRERIEEAS